MCHMEPPVVKLEARMAQYDGGRRERRYYALCFTCLAGWFPDWPDARVAGWLIRQVERGQALAQRKAVPEVRQGVFNLFNFR